MNYTLNSNDEKIIDSILSNSYSICETYLDFAKYFDRLDFSNFLINIKDLVNDMVLVKTDVARNAIAEKLNISIDNSSNKIKELKSTFDLINKKVCELHKALPLPNNEVQKILKMYGFNDPAIDETTDGNFSSYQWHERYLDHLEEKIFDFRQKEIEEAAKADESKADESKVDEPKVDEPKADEPKVDESKADESNINKICN